MKFHGFRSISEYESECAKHGFTTERIPFNPADPANPAAFVLITRMQTASATNVDSWHLFTSDESRELLDGVINGTSANYLDKLKNFGYIPADDRGPRAEMDYRRRHRAAGGTYVFC